MSVAAYSTAGFSQFISASSNVSASQQALQSLQQSLASGNLSDAQSAFNTYQQVNQNLSILGGSSSASGSSSSAGVSSQFSTDLKALGTAIGSGDLSTAQSAFVTLQSDLKTSPSQAVTDAETAATQTVQWVDDLLNLSASSNSSATPLDPTSGILDAAYGLGSSLSATDPISAVLDGTYLGANDGDSGSASGSTSASSGAGDGASSMPSNGNAGSSASVNAYA